MKKHMIRTIKVENLFGLYTYEIPSQGPLSNATILYGDNGVGKSTVLRLAFHLMSPAGDRGHRTQLYGTEFDRLEIELSSGSRLVASVERSGEQSKLLVLEIFDGVELVAAWDYRPREKDLDYRNIEVYFNESGEQVIRRKNARSQKAQGKSNVPRGEQPYLAALRERVPSLFILNADRRLDSDTVADPSDEIELRRTMQYEQTKRINELVARSREIALSQALSSASRWLSRQAVRGTNQGSTNVHQVYSQVVKKIALQNTRSGTQANQQRIDDLVEQLRLIDQMSLDMAKYELSTHLVTSDFKKALRTKSKKKQELAVELLSPYLASVQGRLDAIKPTYELINVFTKIVNSLLSDKQLIFRLSQGFLIENRLGSPLKPHQLSSGEQQLLLLFCYVLIARETPTVFIIDEPEISLNVKWQRQLVSALLEVTAGSNIQFLFASHSMELLAQHRDRVVKLANQQ